MNKTKKRLIPYAELLEKIQGILVCYPECKNIHIDGVQVYRGQEDGANWHVTNFRCSSDDNDLQECKDKIIPEIRNLRTIYDVAEE